MTGRDYLLQQPTVRSIMCEVADKYGLCLVDLIGPSRERKLAWPRQEIFWRCANETKASLPQIGRELGRDHTTVIHGIRKHQARIEACSVKEAG